MYAAVAFTAGYRRHFVALSHAARVIQRTTGEKYLFKILRGSVTPEVMTIEVWSESYVTADGVLEANFRNALCHVNIEESYLVSIPMEGGTFDSVKKYEPDNVPYTWLWDKSSHRAVLTLSAPPAR